MIEKEIKEYKQGRDTVQRINIRKIDNLKGQVCILEINEYKKLITENKTLNMEIKNKNKEIAILGENNKTIEKSNQDLQENIKELSQQYNKIENKTKDQEDIIQELKYANKLLDQQHETITHHRKTIEKLNQQQHETIEKITRQHTNNLERIYDKFNKELQKYIAVNQLQNIALKQILELGFIDMIMNKHKKIAKNQIKELSNDKKVYELTANIKEW